ncbi:MAG: hypothetical protein J0I61_09030 [Bosea sp.]|nr:hypothetical protein [Bosea sp. (in: a-proteobacteria)]
MMQRCCDAVAGNRVEKILEIDPKEERVAQMAMQRRHMATLLIMEKMVRQASVRLDEFDQPLAVAPAVCILNEYELPTASEAEVVIEEHVRPQLVALFTTSMTRSTTRRIAALARAISRTRRTTAEIFRIAHSIVLLLAIHGSIRMEPSTETK